MNKIMVALLLLIIICFISVHVDDAYAQTNYRRNNNNAWAAIGASLFQNAANNAQKAANEEYYLNPDSPGYYEQIFPGICNTCKNTLKFSAAQYNNGVIGPCPCCGYNVDSRLAIALWYSTEQQRRQGVSNMVAQSMMQNYSATCAANQAATQQNMMNMMNRQQAAFQPNQIRSTASSYQAPIQMPAPPTVPKTSPSGPVIYHPVKDDTWRGSDGSAVQAISENTVLVTPPSNE